jgi:transglutaminase-like putative cysteine protease
MRLSQWLSTACLVLVAGLAPGQAAAQQWAPIDPADLSLKTPRVDPAADAEVLLWEVRVTDDTELDDLNTAFDHYIRIKVFNDRGRESEGKVELPFTNQRRVRDIRGRTIAPDGTVTELAGSDVRERTIIETGGVKVKVKSFVMPAVVAGAILEYRWREIRDGELAHELVLPLQREIPVQTVRYLIKPLPELGQLGYTMRTAGFNLKSQPEVSKGPNGFTQVQVRNVSAARTESYMPHELAVRAWLFLHYADSDFDQPEQRFWSAWSKGMFEVYENELKTNNDIKQAAIDATRTATTLEDKIAALVRLTRKRVQRIDTDTSTETGRRKPNEGARDTLKKGSGTGQDAVVLFTALANAAGLEARLAVMPDREGFVAPPAMKQPYFLSTLAAAVKNGATWRFVDVANEHARDGHPRWQQETTYALVLDGKAPVFLSVGMSQPEMSAIRSKGTLKLLANGALEGELAIEYTGHLANQSRERDDDETPAERQRLFSDELVSRLPTAVLSNFRTENLDDPDKPYIVRFGLSVPNYAQRTGSRLILQPGVMQRDVAPMFSAATRAHPVQFPFAWSEDDQVTIELPDGFDVEAGAPPRPITIAQGLAQHTVTLQTSGRTLAYARSFSFGRGMIAFPPAAYTGLKQFFDVVHASDTHVVTLRRIETK